MSERDAEMLALFAAWEFIRDLTDRDETPRVPEKVRDEARELLASLPSKDRIGRVWVGGER